MRRRNSQPHRDQTVYRDYLESTGYCQAHVILRECGVELSRWAGDVCRHHIFGGTGNRIDVPSNLLSVCNDCHAWAHANLKASRVAFLWLKARDGMLDVPELDSAIRKHVAGIVGGYTGLAEPFEKLRLELLAKLEAT